jgi:hypothetical protein
LDSSAARDALWLGRAGQAIGCAGTARRQSADTLGRKTVEWP